nr:hypothetical protein [Desulfurispora thermophila]
MLGNIIAGLIAARLAGYTTRRSFRVAFTIMARGEFSVILASFAAAAGASSHLPPAWPPCMCCCWLLSARPWPKTRAAFMSCMSA